MVHEKRIEEKGFGKVTDCKRIESRRRGTLGMSGCRRGASSGGGGGCRREQGRINQHEIEMKCHKENCPFVC